MKDTNDMGPYYKYRSLNDFKRFIDIIVNNRLYAAKFTDLNDPMEGAFTYTKDQTPLIQTIKNEKQVMRICSMATDCNNGLMWTFYADAHKGCCIEFTIANEFCQVQRVDYDYSIYSLSNQSDVSLILTTKSHYWDYEKESRVLTNDEFVPIHISKIIFGLKISEADYILSKSLIHLINNEIEVRKIRKNEIDFGFESIS